MFPATVWLKSMLSAGYIKQLALNSQLIRQPSAPGKPKHYVPDGSNLPWVVNRLAEEHPERLKEWVEHVRTALPDIIAITTEEMDWNRSRYLVVEYAGGLRVPAWMVSDGTLRLLALTLLAYLPDLEGTFLIEEPENGIHPRAVETMFQALSSVYNAQILMATHSPVILSLAKPEQVLCFAKDRHGATDIVRGDKHPNLADWQGEVGLDVMFAAGVLG